jgi:hypothetical protein
VAGHLFRTRYAIPAAETPIACQAPFKIRQHTTSQQREVVADPRQQFINPRATIRCSAYWMPNRGWEPGALGKVFLIAWLCLGGGGGDGIRTHGTDIDRVAVTDSDRAICEALFKMEPIRLGVQAAM